MPVKNASPPSVTLEDYLQTLDLTAILLMEQKRRILAQDLSGLDAVTQQLQRLDTTQNPQRYQTLQRAVGKDPDSPMRHQLADRLQQVRRLAHDNQRLLKAASQRVAHSLQLLQPGTYPQHGNKPHATFPAGGASLLNTQDCEA